MTSTLEYDYDTSDDTELIASMTDQEKMMYYQACIRHSSLFEDLKNEPDLYEDCR